MLNCAITRMNWLITRRDGIDIGVGGKGQLRALAPCRLNNAAQ